MERQAYLEELDLYLKKLPDKDYQDAKAFFIELFDDAGSEGEAELMASLGSPQEAAADILNQILDRTATPLAQEDDKERPQLPKKWVAQDKGRDHIQDILPAFDSVDVEVGSLDLLISPSSDDTYSLSYFKINESDSLPFTAEVENGVLSVRSVEMETKTYSFGFNLLFKYRNFALSTLVIKVPKVQVLKNLKLNCGSGDLTMRDLHIDDAVINTGSGDLDIRGLQGHKMQLNLGSGDLALSHSQLTYCKYQTGSGDIELDHNQFNQCQFQTGSGDLAATENVFVQSRLGTASGDLCVEAGRLSHTQVSGVSGDVQFEGITYDGKNSCSTVSGDIEIDGLSEFLQTVAWEARTETGDLDIDFLSFSSDGIGGAYQHHIDTSQVNLKISSLSGDIQIT